MTRHWRKARRAAALADAGASEGAAVWAGLRMPSPVCATAQSCLSVCRSGCGRPRSPRSRSVICTRTAATNSLRVSRKGGRCDALAINPADRGAITRLSRSRGHGADNDGPLFRPLKHNGKCRDERRHIEPDAIDRVVRKYAGTFDAFEACHLTAALENTGAARRRAESRRVPRSEHSKAL
jgi:hypothetical protein